MQELAASGVPEQILSDIPADVAAELQRDHPAAWLAIMDLRRRTWEACWDRGFGRDPVEEPDAARLSELRGMTDAELISALQALSVERTPDEPQPADALPPGEEGADG